MKPYLKDIDPADFASWQTKSMKFEQNLYSAELESDLFGETEAVHVQDDGWDDTF